MTRLATSLSLLTVLLISHESQLAAGELPPTVRAAFAKFIGEWDTEFTAGGTAIKGTTSVKWSDNGSSLILNSKSPSAVSGQELTSTEIFGWDGAREIVVERGFMSDGSSISATHPVSDDEWTSPATGWWFVDGKPHYEETVRTFQWKSPDELHIEIKFITPAANRTQVIKCVFRRKS